jgi:23S rRNA (guanosine2251-2'-O)-methyltransferase
MNEGKDILFGFHPVNEALRAGKRKIFRILISRRQSLKRTRKIQDYAAAGKIEVRRVDQEELDSLTGTANHQGIAAEVSPFPVRNAAGIAGTLRAGAEPCFILVLENIEDTHNLGAIIRTALCAGTDYILIPKNRAAKPCAAVSKSSAGAMEHADIYIMTNTASVLRELKESGVWVFGLDGGADRSVFNADLTGNIALVIGGEHKGIRPLVKKECDFLLSIPNQGMINSLNASVAGGIAMFEALRQRL